MKFITQSITVIVCVLAYFIYISPSITDVKALTAKKADYDKVLEKTKELKVKRDSLSTVYRSISDEDTSRLSKLIPETFNSAIFVNDMTALAASDAVLIKDFVINQPETDDRAGIVTTDEKYKTITVSFKVTADYNHFLNFLNSLETSLRLMDVSKISITQGGQKAGDAFDSLVEIHTYSLR